MNDLNSCAVREIVFRWNTRISDEMRLCVNSFGREKMVWQGNDISLSCPSRPNGLYDSTRVVEFLKQSYENHLRAQRKQ